MRKQTEQPGHDHDVCPNCGTELCAGLIAEKLYDRTEEYIKEFYGDKKCFSKVIGVELPYGHPKHYDGVSYWRYPCCGIVYDRFTGEETLLELS